MNVKYRTELFSGTGEREAAKVMAYETFELGNTDILETIKDKFLSNNIELYERSSNFINSLHNIGIVEGLSFESGVIFYNNVLDEIKNITGHEIKYVLWLADVDVLLDKECYGKFFDASANDIDTYEVGPVVLSDLEYDGILYGYTDLPICLEYKLEVLKDVLKDIINDLESDDLSPEFEDELNRRYLDVDNRIQEIKQIISEKELMVNKTKCKSENDLHVNDTSSSVNESSMTSNDKEDTLDNKIRNAAENVKSDANNIKEPDKDYCL